jgi:hypothetical protein
MFATNPFPALSHIVAPAVMQAFVLAMFALVAGGTLVDLVHKKSAQYFFRRRSRGQTVATRRGIGVAVETVLVDWLSAGEFCSLRRRLAHLLTMYGFLAYVIATLVMVFGYPTAKAPATWPLLWHVGALLVCIGGYWFWFFLRADVTAEGHSPFHIVRADLFILSLVANTTLALVWSALQSSRSGVTDIVLGLYVVSTVILFGAVPWSKFSHMFYKPAAALQRRLEEARGARMNLPLPADKPEAFGSTRELPRHY